MTYETNTATHQLRPASTRATAGPSPAPCELARSVLDVAGAAPKWGGDPSNTPPQNRQTDPDCPPDAPQQGGEDWLEGVLYLTWDKECGIALFNALDAAKDAARQAANGQHGEPVKPGERRHRRKKAPTFVTLEGSQGRWIVHPHTIRLGDKSKGPLVSWVIERDGVTFGIIRRLTPHDTYPSAFYRFTGETLTSIGSAERAWEHVKQWFAELGAVVTDNALSRVDACVDLPGVGVDDLVAAVRECRVVSRIKRRKEECFLEVFGSTTQDTGFRLGSGTMLRVYDKAVECKDLAKRSWIIHRRWGGQDQEKALRCEFQLRTEFLRASKNKTNDGKPIRRPVVRTIEDYFTHRAELLDYLTTDWIKFVNAEGFDRRQTKRATEMPLWTMIRERFQHWAGVCNVDRWYAPPPREAINIEALVKQVRGCMISAAAAHHEGIDGPDDFLGFINDAVWKVIQDDPDLRDEVLARKNDLCPVTHEDLPF